MENLNNQHVPPAGPYSQAIKSNGFIFCSGQLGIDPSSGELVSDNICDQTKQAIANLRAILSSNGSDLTKIVKVTLFITSMADFKDINEMYALELGGHKPARSTVEISNLPLGAKVEIECIAEQ